MSIDSAATFLASSILIGSGVVILVGCAVAVSQLLSKYWVPFKMFVYRDINGPTVGFTEPHMEQNENNQTKS